MGPVSWRGIRKMIEVGCGTADISGFLAMNDGYGDWQAYGIECHQGALIEAILRYGKEHFTPIHANIVPIGPGPLVDIVILAEVLEHLEDPMAVAASWLRRARFSVISHPMNESDGSQLSGGDHCFSLSEEDHKEFFVAGGHEIDETVVFKVGLYDIILSRGHRKDA